MSCLSRVMPGPAPRALPAMQENVTQYKIGAPAWNRWQMSLMSAKRLQT